MASDPSLFDPAMELAVAHARNWLGSVAERPVGPNASADEMRALFGGPLPEHGEDVASVVDELARRAEPGLMAMGSGRFFGWVIGGTLPAALAADWLTSAWDQNAGLRYATPAVVAIEETAAAWLLDLLHLPLSSDVGFVTGATMANFSCLAAARGHVLRQVGWDVHRDGLSGAPKVTVLVGDERHETVDLALRYLGLGSPTAVVADDQGRLRSDALADALDSVPAGSPVILCLQAGNVHSGAFDPFDEAISLARGKGAWVHVDGAFGLWASASPKLAPLVHGIQRADSWGTDAHKTLNVPYDCGLAIVARREAMRSALGIHANYLVADESGPGDPCEKVPELSRRARGVPVWAALRSLGRRGVVDLVDGLAEQARAFARGLVDIEGAEVLNDVVYTQVCAAFGVDEHTRAITERILSDGTTWMSGSRWRDRAVLRISVSNWRTGADDVKRSLAAVRRAAQDEGDRPH